MNYSITNEDGLQCGHALSRASFEISTPTDEKHQIFVTYYYEDGLLTMVLQTKDRLENYTCSHGRRQHPLIHCPLNHWMLAETMAQLPNGQQYRTGGCWLWSG